MLSGLLKPAFLFSLLICLLMCLGKGREGEWMENEGVNYWMSCVEGTFRWLDLILHKGWTEVGASGQVDLTDSRIWIGIWPSQPPDQGPEGEENKCIDWDLVKPKNEKLYNFTNCNGALPNEGFGAREPDSNPTYPLTGQIIYPSKPGHRE